MAEFQYPSFVAGGSHVGTAPNLGSQQGYEQRGQLQQFNSMQQFPSQQPGQFGSLQQLPSQQPGQFGSAAVPQYGSQQPGQFGNQPYGSQPQFGSQQFGSLGSHSSQQFGSNVAGPGSYQVGNLGVLPTTSMHAGVLPATDPNMHNPNMTPSQHMPMSQHTSFHDPTSFATAGQTAHLLQDDTSRATQIADGADTHQYLSMVDDERYQNRQRGLRSRSALNRKSSGLENLEQACEDPECIEQLGDPEDCGDDITKPTTPDTVLGIDKRHLLPVLFGGITVLGGVCMALVQLPKLQELTGSPGQPPTALTIVWYILYVVTLICMAWAAFADPGQIQGFKKDVEVLPKRAHKAWQYEHPIRRYDHYCRWLKNCIGLLNHREFFLMLLGLISICILGGLLDAVLIISTMFTKLRLGYAQTLIIVVHLICSMIKAYTVGPILRIHLGLVSRNELAQEWKRNIFYVAEVSNGGWKSVTELDDDEHNEFFDMFEYDPTKNEFDKGFSGNVCNFFLKSRCGDTMGEF